ncbi:uncharacterized protein K452DRAFT_326207 [Aplosporella prunicola CBS 121167]|uniref:Uncharacterized protein n=1 Tax=Aplosporella prunicola CBS 121167 TaxID=1176127 RepID=A0A6A6BI64_9PEZI|nr:uncharacterized protein K452DRAFT_326207 [Aplosporella prunicola CBS 121167]KAF2143025.1 hypothetical protein K452DRAFT_326207 [Aplosporella prunicola CBS 121167]
MSSRNPSHPPHRTTTASGVRRNLFNSNLSRRPTAASSASGTSATTIQVAEEPAADRDIVARDEEGNYKLETPELSMHIRDEEQEEREAANQLIESYRKHQHIETSEPEFKATLQASLQAKVESLDEDKWMFEGEDPTPS